MEILVPHHGLNGGVVGVRCNVGRCHHVAGVKDVEALIFHGAEVKVIGCHDHEAVKVKFQTPALLIPENGLFQTLQRPGALVEILLFGPDLQQALVPVFKRDFVAAHGKAAGHQGKEVAGLFKGIFPARPVAPFAFIAASHKVAVGKKHRVGGLVRVHCHRKAAHHVGAVGPVGDRPEPLGLALAHKGPRRHVDAREIRVFGRAEAVYDRDVGLVAYAVDRERVFGEAVFVVLGLTVIDSEAFKREVVPV